MSGFDRRTFLASAARHRRIRGGRIVARRRSATRRPAAVPARAFLRRPRWPRRLRPARARLVPRASRPRDLHRRLPAGLPPRRCEGLPHRRRARGQGARRARSFAIRAAISSPATTGSTASARRRSGRPCSIGRGTRSRRISSAPTSSSTGAALVGTEPLLGMNFGTGTAEMAVAYVEYCNLDRGTKWSELRRVARLRAAAQRALLVPRQRDGRAVADRPAAGARVRAQGARRRQADARASTASCS